MSEMVLKGGRVVGPDGVLDTDVLIRDGIVLEIGVDLESDRVIDCGGALIGPGFVDTHVHFREPGQEWKEDIETGSRAAAAGGFTAVVAMANTDPAIDAGHLARYVSERGSDVGLVDVVPAGAITLGRAGTHLSHLDELWAAGVRLFSDDGDSVQDTGLLRLAMEYLSDLGGIVAQHAEDTTLTRGAHMHEGAVSARLGMRGMPALAEEVIIMRDLALVELTGVRYHVQHVSTAGSVRLVEEAKERGLPVTAEVTPHHLAFDHRQIERMDPAFKMYPPLRTKSDVAAVREALRTGVIDVVGTDHAPHAAAEKDVPFDDAPRGVIGLETAAAVVNEAVPLDPVKFFERLSVTAARLLGLDRHGRWPEPGIPANLVVFAPEVSWTPQRFASRSENSPFKGRAMKGRVLATIHDGVVSYEAP
jgi:dihydroorotase